MKLRLLLPVVCILIAPIRLFAGEPVDLQIISSIREEGFNRSRIMETLSYMTDVHGPRLTGSPGLKGAAEWCRDEMVDWGLENARLERWGEFGRGWEVEHFSIEMLEPSYVNVIAYPKAWTPGTDGTITGTPILIDAKSVEDLEQYEGKLEGAIVMTEEPREPETSFEPDAERHSDKDLAEIAHAPEPGLSRFGNFDRDAWRARRALRNKMREVFQEEGVAVLLEPSRGAHGTLFVQSGGSHEADAEPAPPSLVVSYEHYGRIARLLKKDVSVTLKIDIKNHFIEDTDGYNVVAEIPGADPKLKDELVMLGGHLDSWQSSPGATDNAAGCAVAMEAARILKAIGAEPRRTIRVALWTGEEQGLLGSRAYVKKHFGDRDTMELQPDHERLSAYFNLDNGTGKIRGIYCQGNAAVRPIFEAYLKPFHDLDATTTTLRNTGGTDHLSFDAVGLPGFQFIQDQIDYNTRTHHTSMDSYERIIKGDVMQAAVLMASFAYHTANRDQKLPRKALPKPREPREERGARGDRESRDVREPRGAREGRRQREPRAAREPRKPTTQPNKGAKEEPNSKDKKPRKRLPAL
jgi:hypothetical protein